MLSWISRKISVTMPARSVVPVGVALGVGWRLSLLVVCRWLGSLLTEYQERVQAVGWELEVSHEKLPLQAPGHP